MIKDLEMGRFFWIIWVGLIQSWGFPGGSVVKNPLTKTGDLGLIPGSERFPGGGNGNPLQHSCLENPRDSGAWWAAIYGVAQSQTRLKQLSSSSSSSFLPVQLSHPYMTTGKTIALTRWTFLGKGMSLLFNMLI